MIGFQRSPRFRRVRIQSPGLQTSRRKQIEDEKGQVVALSERDSGQPLGRIERSNAERLQLTSDLVELIDGQLGLAISFCPHD